MTAPRMHADEVAIDSDLVRRLLAAQYPDWAELTIEPVVPWGTDNALFRVGDGLVVRLPRHAPKVAPLEKELRWLPALAPQLPLAVPVPLAIGRPADGYPFPWAVYEWLPGKSATDEPVADEERLASELAGFIAALQRIDTAGAPEPSEKNSYRGCPLIVRDESTKASIADLATTIDAARVSAVWEAALRTPEWDRAPVWIHGDLDARNLLVVEERLSAVIDWGCLGVGDPAYDVMVAWKMLSAEARDLFRAELAVDDDTWTRARGLVVSQAVIALGYYTLETNPVLVHEAERWMAEVLSESD